MCPGVGRRGKKRNCGSKGPVANDRRDSDTTPFIWRNDARRHLVGATAARLSRLIGFYRLFDVGGVSGQELFRRQLHLAVLFAGNFRRLTPTLVESVTGLLSIVGWRRC